MNNTHNLAVIERESAVASRFYPADPAVLTQQILEALKWASLPDYLLPSNHVPKVLIVPHAGYVYSGKTAASAYTYLSQMKSYVRRVVLIGPAHHHPVLGIATSSCTHFRTPLGSVPLDTDLLAKLNRLPGIIVSDEAHAPEHSLEVHLPFLQQSLGDFRLVPLLVGRATPEHIAGILDYVWGDKETLIVISSDLSHYHPYAVATKKDGQTIESILSFRSNLVTQDACGAFPLNGLMLQSQARGMQIELFDYCNSGDAEIGDRNRVVGYAAFGLFERPAEGNVLPQGIPMGGDVILTQLARSAILEALGVATGYSIYASWLEQMGAVFVTLTKDGILRGCIGSLSARRSFLEDVRHNAVAAAMEDPRFPKLSLDELDKISIEVSILSPALQMLFVDEADALRQLRPGIDGVIFESAGRRATFLPQVWDNLTTPSAFMAALRQKAGFPENYWNPDVQIQRYQVHACHEKPMGA